jgi:hypothetical protein
MRVGFNTIQETIDASGRKRRNDVHDLAVMDVRLLEPMCDATVLQPLAFASNFP